MPPQIGRNGVTEIKDYDYGNFTDRKPEDFDFACSPTFREFYQERFGYGANLYHKFHDDGEKTPAPSEIKRILPEEIVALAQQAKLQSQENRRDLQEHFKHHSYIGKKRKSNYD